MANEVNNLDEILSKIEQANSDGNGDVSMEAILESIGRRSFGPLLLLAGLITLAPIVGDIPGVPTLMGIFVLIISGQLIFQRQYFWLPELLLNRSVSKEKITKAFKWLHR